MSADDRPLPGPQAPDPEPEPRVPGIDPDLVAGPAAGAGPAAAAGPEPVAGPGRSEVWLRRAGIWAAIGVAALLLVWLLSAFVPRWWAQQAGGLVDSSIGRGIWWGLAIGFVFTAVPLAIAWQAFRPRRSWKVRVSLLVAALLCALPNLMTLSVVLGTNSSAHAGRRIMDVDAPAFRTATGWGAVVAVLVVALTLVLWRVYRRNRRQLKAARLAAQLAAQQEGTTRDTRPPRAP